MDETRSVKITFTITPSLAARFAAYARQHHWSQSTAAAVLVENGLTEAEKEASHENQP